MRQLAPEQAADTDDVGNHQRLDANGVDDVEGDCTANVDQRKGS